MFTDGPPRLVLRAPPSRDAPLNVERRAYRFSSRSAPLALPVALALGGIDRVYPRHLIATWIPVGIAAALGFAVRRHARVATVALAALCCAWVGIHLATFDHPKFGDENWRAAARAVGPAAHKTALVVTPGGARIASHRLPGRADEWSLPPPP